MSRHALVLAWHRLEGYLLLDSTPVFDILMIGGKTILLSECSQDPKVRRTTGQMSQNWTYLTFSIRWICVWFLEDKFFNSMIKTKSMQKLYIISTQNSVTTNIGTAMCLSSQQRCQHIHPVQQPSRNSTFTSSSVVLSCGLSFPIWNEGVYTHWLWWEGYRGRGNYFN